MKIQEYKKDADLISDEYCKFKLMQERYEFEKEIIEIISNNDFEIDYTECYGCSVLIIKNLKEVIPKFTEYRDYQVDFVFNKIKEKYSGNYRVDFENIFFKYVR